MDKHFYNIETLKIRLYYVIQPRKISLLLGNLKLDFLVGLVKYNKELQELHFI